MELRMKALSGEAGWRARRVLSVALPKPLTIVQAQARLGLLPVPNPAGYQRSPSRSCSLEERGGNASLRCPLGVLSIALSSCSLSVLLTSVLEKKKAFSLLRKESPMK